MSELAVPSGPPLALTLPNLADLDRRTTVVKELTDEYRIWTSYAQAAHAAATLSARLTSETVCRSQCAAAFAANLSERYDADLAAASRSVDTVHDEVADAVMRVRERLNSLEQSLDIAQRALQSWTIALARSAENRERALLRLHTAQISHRRLVAAVKARAGTDEPKRQRAQRDLGHAADDIARFTNDIEAADELVDRYAGAVGACGTATQLAQEAVDRQRSSCELVYLAEDHLGQASLLAEHAIAILQRQQEATRRMTQNSMLAVRSEEQAGRLFGVANTAYEDAQQHACETRRQLLDHAEQLQMQSMLRREGLRCA